MRVKTLKEALSNLPDDLYVELGHFISMKEVEGQFSEPVSVRLDFPIVGIARDEGDNAITFVTSSAPEEHPWLVKFGKVEPLGGSETDSNG